VKPSNHGALARARTFDLVTFEIGYGTRIVLAGDHTAKLARDRKVREHQNASDAYQSNGGRMAGNVLAGMVLPLYFPCGSRGSSGMLAIVDLRKDTRL
jgi:hypothetical protein